MKKKSSFFFPSILLSVLFVCYYCVVVVVVCVLLEIYKKKNFPKWIYKKGIPLLFFSFFFSFFLLNIRDDYNKGHKKIITEKDGIMGYIRKENKKKGKKSKKKKGEREKKK